MSRQFCEVPNWKKSYRPDPIPNWEALVEAGQVPDWELEGETEGGTAVASGEWDKDSGEWPMARGEENGEEGTVEPRAATQGALKPKASTQEAVTQMASEQGAVARTAVSQRPVTQRAARPRAFTADTFAAESFASGRPTQFGKTQRAFSTYTTLVDTAEWMRWQMRGQLEMYGLSMGGFRLLEMLCREGATSIVEAAQKRECSRHNMEEIVASLEKREFVRRKVVTLAPAEVRETKLAKAKRGQPREGRRMLMVEATRAGRKLLKVVLPGHAKVVKALMRVLDGREQDTLRKLCEKLREEDIMKYMQEMAYEG
jgi:DNA-binding MarR family transcriptional regulator